MCDLEPLEFVAAIKNAKYVVTDSYHAMLFSIIYNRKFYIIERNYLTNKSQSDRIYSMLGILNIKNRYIRNITDMECSDVIDYDFVNEVIERERKKSKRYLVSALCGAKE